MAGRIGLFEDWISEDGLTTIEGWAREGLTDKQIAEEKIGINQSTLCEWKKRFPQLAEALKKGKAPVDTKVENALLKRALGYDYEEVTTEITEVDGTQRKIIKKVKKHVVPDTTAQIYWLSNRRPDRWRRNPSVETSVDDPLVVMLKQWEDAAHDSKPETT